MSNWFYILVALALVWAVVSAFLVASPGQSDKRRRVGGFMMFGPFWPLMEKELSRSMSQREIIGWGVVVLLMLVGIFLEVANVL